MDDGIGAAREASSTGGVPRTGKSESCEAGPRRYPRRRRVPRLPVPPLTERPVLPGGQALVVRAASPEDGERLRHMFARLSPTSIYQRFHSPFPRVPEWAVAHAVEVDHRDKLSLVALVDGEIVGQAMYARLARSDEAEVAVVVEDAWQRYGIGSLLLSRLAEEASRQGIGALTGAVLHENGAMRALLAGFVTLRYSKEDGMHLAHVPLRASGPAPVAGEAR
jgi:GNAT superfamily N-acetyltransferase